MYPFGQLVFSREGEHAELRVDSGSGRRSWRLRSPMQHCSAAPLPSGGGGDPSHSSVTHHPGLTEALGKRGRDH